MKKSVKHVLAGIGIAAGAVGTGVVSITKHLMSIALDRQSPISDRKAKSKLSGSSEHHVLLEKLDAVAAMLENADCERKEITARDGTKLVGHWRGCENPERVIIAMHGWRSSWAKDFGAVAESWYEKHCSVLYVEQRGQNESGGDYMSLGLMERYDCLDWLSWLEQQDFVRHRGTKLPIYLCGVSMGATSVLMAAGLGLPESVHGIIADCGFTSPHDICKHITEDNLHISYALCEELAEYYCKGKINVGTKEASTIEAMENCRTPILFIHGTEDTFVPIEMTYKNYRACKGPKRLFVVPGAGHGMSYFTDQTGYEAAVKAFWDDYDSKES